MFGLPPSLQGLLKEQLEIVKYKTPAGGTRYTIRALGSELSFDKVLRSSPNALEIAV